MKKFLIKCIQACINSYGGEHGKVKPVFEKTKEFTFKNCQGFFGYEDDTLWIIFRGTDQLDDWVKNFRFSLKKINNIKYKKVTPYEGINPKVKVHEGFIIIYKQAREVIFNEAEKYNKIVVTGHSLGGALTTLCALDLSYWYPDKYIFSVPIASPKVGNKYFVRSYNKRVPHSIRIVYGEDYITKVPLGIMGYPHVKKLLHIGKSNILFKIPFLRVIGVKDHYPQKYLENIKKANV